MSVSRLLALALLLAGCDRFDPAPLPSTSAPEVPSASPPSPEETHRLARAATDAALACARTCVIHAPSFDDAADACPADPTLVKALAESALALSIHVRDAGVRGDAAAFSTTASLFAEWMAEGVKIHRTRGTLRLFQDVADAWNRYRPTEPIPVDPIEELRRYGFGSKGYIMQPVKKVAGRIAWRTCYDGPCVFENHW
jgi:hypothetical protein